MAGAMYKVGIVTARRDIAMRDTAMRDTARKPTKVQDGFKQEPEHYSTSSEY